MSNAALKGFGTLLGVGDGGGPEVFTTIAEIMSDITGPGISSETFETTSHENTAMYNTHAVATIEPGEVSLSINYIPTNATHQDASGGLLALLESGALTNFEITFTDSGASKMIVPAIVTGFEFTAEIKGRLGANVTLKVSGQPTYV